MKKRGKRISAWLMVLVMVWSLVMVPAGKAEAAETVTNATDENKSVYVELKAEKKIAVGTWGDNSPAVELTQYAVVVHNKSEGMISDWTVTIESTDASSWNAGWNGATRSGNTITVGTYKGTDDKGKVWTNAEIAAGETGTGAGFQIASSALTNATVTLTYSVGASSGDVSQDATATDPAAIGTSSSSVTATITQSNISGEYHEYFLQVNNGLSESISDWIVAIPLTGITSAEQWDTSWAKIKISYNSSYLYLTPSGSGDNVMSPGGSFGSSTDGGYKFNYKGSSNIDTSKVVVYYKTGTSSSGAFDAVVSNATQASGSSGSGSGGSSGGSLTDTTTDLNLDVDYNYAKLLQESLYFYDGNMCGPDVGENSGFSWRDDCHTADQTVTYKGKTIDVSGGFHDAGDHVKFGLPQGYSATVLALSYYEFKEAYDELGQTAHYQKIMDYFCDYFVNCTVYKDDKSGVEAFCYQVGEGNSDHGYWGAPEAQTTARPAYFATSSNPATDEVSVAIAALALHAKNFPDSEKSAKYLQTAKDLFAFVKANSKGCATEGASGFYASSDWKDDYCSAAAALWVATNGGSEYETELNSYYTSGNIKTGWVLTWDNTWAVASVLKEDWNTVKTFASYGNTNTAQGFKLVDGWGSARYNTTLQFLGLAYDKGNDKFTMEDGDFGSWATGQMKYLLGNNNAKRCFVVGYNENSSQYPHHRAASRSTDSKITNPDHYTLLGALVGGPSDANDTYADNQGDYNCNEVALDYNAGFVGAAAGLYLLHKNDADASNGLASETELADIGVDIYYGSVQDPVAATGVSVTPTETTLTVGDTKQLKATVAPSGATNKKVSWTSSDDKIATVDAKGVVTAVAAGTATITAKAEDGGFTATCEVTVVKKPAVAPVINGSGSIEVVVGTQLKDVSTAGYTAKSGTTKVEGTFSWKEANKTLSMADTDTAYTLVFTPKDTDSYTTAEKSVTFTIVRKENTNKPEAPKLQSKTDSTVILVAYSGTEAVEYGILLGDEYTWQNDTTFTKLDAYASYTFAMRFAETEDSLAGQEGEALTVKTNFKEADTYIVDLGRLSESGYIDAHNGTITYDETTKTLTLENADQTYTITGTNAEITVITKNSETVLKDATLNKLESETDMTLKLSGDNTVAAGIESTKTIEIQNGSSTSEAGALNVSSDTNGAIVADKIIIESGEVTATGSDEAPALKGTNEIDLLGGTLTANADVKPIQVDTTQEGAKILLDGCQVKSNTDNPYNADPVDKDGNTVVSCQVIYKDEEAGTEETVLVKKGSEITLANLTAKKGYKALGWCIEGASGEEADILAQGTKVTVDETITYVAKYKKIVGGLSVTAANAPALIAGYTTDEGVTITVQNDSNIPLEEVVLSLDNNEDFTLSKTSITGLAAGDSVEVKIVLKSGKAAKEEGYEVIVTASSASKEVDAASATLKRIVNAAEKKVTKISVELEEYTIKAGTTTKATATITPENATNKTVTWSSSDKSIATVTQDGTVTAVAEGEVEIIATAQDGSDITGKNVLTVTKAEETENPEEPTDKEVTKVTVALEENTIKAGSATKATATVTPEDATNKAVTWSTGNEKIATVTQDGTVTAVAEGVVDIIATAQDGSGITGKAVLTVTKNPTQTSDTGNENTGNKDNGNSQPATTEAPQSAGSADEVKATGIQVTVDVKNVDNILVSGTMKLAPKKKMQLAVSFQPEDAEEEELTFTSSNPKVATVDEDGEIKAGKEPGKTTITVKSANGLTKSFQVQVMKKAVTKVKLQVKTKNLKAGKTLKVKATLSPSKKLASNNIYWTTSNSKVATVTQKGVVKGVKKGKAKITATATDGSGKKATITIKVK